MQGPYIRGRAVGRAPCTAGEREVTAADLAVHLDA